MLLPFVRICSLKEEAWGYCHTHTFLLLPKNEYYSRKFDVYISYDEIILRCLKLNTVFWDGYNILQELLHYDKYETYSEAERFLDRIISKLIASNDELLFKVASSYKKWKVGIINGLARNQTGKRFSNAIAENNNSHIQKIINVSYGYRSFKRFRARIMLILSYKKTERCIPLGYTTLDVIVLGLFIDHSTLFHPKCHRARNP